MNENETGLLNKIEALEKRCPGTTFHRDNLEALARGEQGKFHFETIMTGGGFGEFVVDLSEMGITMGQWLDDELARFPATTMDDWYFVICPTHGKVQIGLAGYDAQMAFPNSRWVCPRCGAIAKFDEDTFEDHLDRLINQDTREEEPIVVDENAD